MKFSSLLAVTLGLVLGAAFGQNAPARPSAPPPDQSSSGPSDQGQRGDHGGWGRGAGVTGTVTAIATDHYTIKNEVGEIYTIHYSVNTRILKQNVQHGGGGGQRGGSNPPQTLKATDIKVGDAVAAIGDVDAAAKSVGAVVILQIDPERAKQLQEMQANFAKTWLMGKVTAINETTVTLFSSVDHASHSFVVDENTGFRKRREPITLADIAVGDVVRAEGAVTGGTFVALSVNVMGMPQGGPLTLPREGSASAQGGK